jgi:hypothetical protein
MARAKKRAADRAPRRRNCSESAPTKAVSPISVLSDEELDEQRLALSRRYFERRSDQRLHEHFAQALRESGRVSVADETARRPRLMIATGESGAGKTCALLRLIGAFPELAWSKDGRIRPHRRR